MPKYLKKHYAKEGKWPFARVLRDPWRRQNVLISVRLRLRDNQGYSNGPDDVLITFSFYLSGVGGGVLVSSGLALCPWRDFNTLLSLLKDLNLF